MPYEVRIIESVESNFQEIKSLYQLCRWDLLDDNKMKEALSSSYTIYGGYIDSKLVSFARTISDQNIYAFIIDVMVDPSERRKGYGHDLMNFLLSDLKKRDIKVVQLLSSEKGKNIYLKNGFNICPESAPGMILFLN